jgi:transcriptional regulator with XRE-family HTH domain
MNSLGEARQARGLTLADVAAATRLSPRYIKAIDEGRYEDLPAGLYARAYVRAYAAAVELQPSALEPILPLLPAAADPLPVLKDVCERDAMRLSVPVSARLAAAVTVDAMLLLVVSGAIATVVGSASGLGLRALVEHAPLPLTLLCAATWVQYFVLLAGVHGRTPGEIFCGLPDRPSHAPLNLVAILHRATRPPLPAA